MTGLQARHPTSSGNSSSSGKEEDGKVYEVERVLSHQDCGDTYHYLIKWKNFPASENT
jgi:hypothetical protein